MELEIIMLNETSQTWKYKYHMSSLICRIEILKRHERKRGTVEGDQW
jgi:hypothetical protein